MLASSVVAWALDDMIRGAAGAGASMLLATIAGGVTFFLVKRFMSDLRAGS
jgi:heme/copper-type cytochrome/quinol oxidase subunit 3